jgi:hypothetical protein
MWHERMHGNGQCLPYSYHVGVGSNNYVGSTTTGAIYRLALDVYTDNGTAIMREVISPHIGSNDSKFTRFGTIVIDMEGGHGAPYTYPLIMLDHSDDRGYNFVCERHGRIGGAGEYGRRVVFFKNGASPWRTFRFRITDAVRIVILTFDVDIT